MQAGQAECRIRQFVGGPSDRGLHSRDPSTAAGGAKHRGCHGPQLARGPQLATPGAAVNHVSGWLSGGRIGRGGVRVWDVIIVWAVPVLLPLSVGRRPWMPAASQRCQHRQLYHYLSLGSAAAAASRAPSGLML